jgi:hypothetical protein
MDELEAIRKLVKQARKEQVPDFDMADRVLARTRELTRATAMIRPMKVLAAISGLAAAVILVIALGTDTGAADPEVAETANPEVAFFPTVEVQLP